MDTIAITIASFVCIIIAGIVARRIELIGSGGGDLISRLVFNITLPAAIIHAFGSVDFDPTHLILIPVGVACTLGPFLLAIPLTRASELEDRRLYLLNIGGLNVGCFALPFVQALFPPAAVVATCMFDAGNALLMSGGSYALTQVITADEPPKHPVAGIAKRLLTSVPFDAYLLLIALAVFGIRVPPMIVQLLSPIADANAFLSLFMLGLMINFSVDQKKLGKLARLLGARIALSACMCAAVLAFLPLEGEVLLVIAILTWAPMATMGTVFTLWMKADYGLAGLATSLSVVAGIIAMTLLSLYGPGLLQVIG
ncbi:AEC family transporter [Collinsella vaginalis]|uniref:AEC family transporter n=1 Tax=Collinsella vaginalis TaxID=1870987 RepID=UPI000A26C46E|nr:AEC family transporter [Collinsella vaginalis]